MSEVQGALPPGRNPEEDLDQLLEEALSSVSDDELGKQRFEDMAERYADGMRVTLYQSLENDRFYVEIVDDRTGDYRQVWVREGDSPMEVFYHPFAYEEHRYGNLGDWALKAA
ncbi:MAG TPA: hypothetical protein VLF88_02395 [Candidatus Babeliales bacterium]|nr:hypothetical protein [Candidatus Babeliales bacterium]